MTNTTSTVPVSPATFKSPPNSVATGGYDRASKKQGIVHLGVGAFHRSHQALYIDELLSSHGVDDWAICGVGIMPQDKNMNEAMQEQQCIYTLVEKAGDKSSARIIGSITEYIFGHERPHAVFTKMEDRSIRIVSMTATEGGYCFSAKTGELDLENPAVQNDLRNPHHPQTIYGYLAEGLKRRMQAGMPPFTVLSCDNLQGNGHITKKMLLAFCRQRDAALADWVERHVSFPNCMVDRITPATTDAERQYVAQTYGLTDRVPVVAEPFRQWVIEDDFCNGRPPLEKVGVQFTRDVAPYEKMKLRLLNATHSAMGYLGYLCGYRYIYEIARAPQFKPYLTELMDVEVTPLVGSVPGVNLSEYKASLMERFANETIKDQALRICMDGSGKMPKFILTSIQEQLAQGGPIRRLTLCVASWMRFLNGKDEQGQEIPIVDPQAERLHQAALAGGKDPRKLLALSDIFGDLGANERFVAELESLLRMLYDKGAGATLDYVVKNPR